MPLKSLPVPSVKTFSVVFFGAESSLIAAFDNLREIHATLIRLKCLVGPTQVLKANNRGEFAFTCCDLTKFYESSLSGVNPSELLRLCPAAEAEAQQERGSNPETQGNFFRVWSTSTRSQFHYCILANTRKTEGASLRCPN